MELTKTQIVKLADIIPSKYNPRVKLTAKDQEYKALDSSVQENGLVLPLIVNIRDMGLIGGHQRLSVLLASGETETRAVIVDMSEKQAKALMIALNKLDGTWDYGQAAEILQELIDEQRPLLSTGFTEKDIKELLGEIQQEMSSEQLESIAKKEDTSDGIKVLVGEFKFTITEIEFEDLMAEVREKVGFTKELVCDELKRRLFG